LGVPAVDRDDLVKRRGIAWKINLSVLLSALKYEAHFAKAQLLCDLHRAMVAQGCRF
jgi:hypothetical protein